MQVALLRTLRDRARARARDERGETLLELMVTVVLLGLAIVAILSGLFAVVVASDQHRRVTRAGNELVTLSEAVYAAPYVACSTTSGAPVALTEYRKVYGTGGLAQPPQGYRFEVVSVQHLRNRTAATPTWGACPTTDQGAQLVQLRVTNIGRGNGETLWIVKRAA